MLRAMTIPFTQHFDALLPAVAAPVRITSFYDAQVFTRRWVIRDKDPNLKVLLRKMEKANSAALIDEAIGSFKQELSVRALLPAHDREKWEPVFGKDHAPAK
jgi:hypothetical protein